MAYATYNVPTKTKPSPETVTASIPTTITSTAPATTETTSVVIEAEPPTSVAPLVTETPVVPVVTEAQLPAPAPETTEDPAPTVTVENNPKEPLVGHQLLELVKTCGEQVPREELVRMAGYTKQTKDGTRLMYSMFQEALLEAMGMTIGAKPAPSESKGKMGHPLSFITRVHFNGNVMVGRAYVAMLDDHEKGKEFRVVVNPETNPGGINLVPVQD